MENYNIKDISMQSKEHLEAYAKNQLELVKLETTSKLARLLSFIFLGFFLSLFALVFTIMLSIALGIFLGQLLDNNALAFLIVSGIYIVLALGLYLLRTVVFKNPFLRMFINELK